MLSCLVVCSSDELYAYLSHWRPDLCVLEGGSEEGEGDKDEFVLVDNGEEEEEEVSKNHGRTGEDWEVSLYIKVIEKSLKVCSG